MNIMRKARCTSLALLALAGTAAAVAAPPPGKGGKGGGASSDVEAIGVFRNGGADRILPDGSAEYKTANLNGGWSEFPPSGSYVLHLDGRGLDRTVTLDFNQKLAPGDDTSDPAYGSYVIHMAVDFSCPVDVPDCDRADFPESTIENMVEGGSDVLAMAGMRFPAAPLEGAYILRCGFRPWEQEFMDSSGTDYVRVSCTQGVGGDGSSCGHWTVTPESATENQLRCSLWREVTGGRGNKKSRTITFVGDFNMNFGLDICRDSDGDGTADIVTCPY